MSFKCTLMQIWKSPYIFGLHMNINMPKILHYSIFYLLRYAPVRYEKYLFTNIQKQ